MSAADLKRPDMLRYLASLPYYGQAMVEVRKADPWWKVELPALFRVEMEFDDEDAECPTCGCTCGTYDRTAIRTVEVEAMSEEEAEQAALDAHPGWTVWRVDPPKPCKIEFPHADPAASVDTRRMAETGTGSGRSPSGAVPEGETP